MGNVNRLSPGCCCRRKACDYCGAGQSWPDTLYLIPEGFAAGTCDFCDCNNGLSIPFQRWPDWHDEHGFLLQACTWGGQFPYCYKLPTCGGYLPAITISVEPDADEALVRLISGMSYSGGYYGPTSLIAEGTIPTIGSQRIDCEKISSVLSIVTADTTVCNTTGASFIVTNQGSADWLGAYPCLVCGDDCGGGGIPEAFAITFSGFDHQWPENPGGDCYDHGDCANLDGTVIATQPYDRKGCSHVGCSSGSVISYQYTWPTPFCGFDTVYLSIGGNNRTSAWCSIGIGNQFFCYLVAGSKTIDIPVDCTSLSVHFNQSDLWGNTCSGDPGGAHVWCKHPPTHCGSLFCPDIQGEIDVVAL